MYEALVREGLIDGGELCYVEAWCEDVERFQSEITPLGTEM